MKLFQYWDSQQPPDEVAGWIQGFRERNPELDHRLYHRDKASWFIGKHFGEREQRAFDACAVPAMQSDYFRYCALERSGGVYADADYQSGEPLIRLLAKAPRSLLLEWRGQWVGGLMMFRAAGDPFVRACRELTTLNIEARRYDNAFTATGPGVLNAIRLLFDPAAEPAIMAGLDNPYGRTWRFPELAADARASVAPTQELRAAFEAITILHHLEVERWIGTAPPAYKKTAQHWLHWEGPVYRK